MEEIRSRTILLADHTRNLEALLAGGFHVTCCRTRDEFRLPGSIEFEELCRT